MKPLNSLQETISLWYTTEITMPIEDQLHSAKTVERTEFTASQKTTGTRRCWFVSYMQTELSILERSCDVVIASRGQLGSGYGTNILPYISSWLCSSILTRNHMEQLPLPSYSPVFVRRDNFFFRRRKRSSKQSVFRTWKRRQRSAGYIKGYRFTSIQRLLWLVVNTSGPMNIVHNRWPMSFRRSLVVPSTHSDGCGQYMFTKSNIHPVRSQAFRIAWVITSSTTLYNTSGNYTERINSWIVNFFD